MVFSERIFLDDVHKYAKIKYMIQIYGDIIEDIWIRGSSSRLSPEAPVAIVDVDSTSFSLGGAHNVYSNVKNLTDNVTLDTHVCGGKLPSKTRIISDGHYITRVDQNYKTLWRHSAHKQDSTIVISDYNYGAVASFRHQIDITDPRLKVIVDPKHNLQIYSGVWCAKPNIKSFESYAGKWDSYHNLRELMASAITNLSISHLIVTLGDNGVAYMDSDYMFHMIPAEKRLLCDVTGAGDTFMAVLAYGIDNGMSMLDSIILANKAAGIAVTHRETYNITKDDIGEVNPKIVFTNGCFDCLHAGHIDLLNRSKSLGGKLIVGINSDDTIRKLKGDARPIDDVNTRRSKLDSLGIVDEVIVFDELTPINLINKLQPDIITKGGDYDVEDVVANETATIVIIPRNIQISTTDIIKEMKCE